MIPLNEKDNFVVVVVIWKKKKQFTNHKLNAEIKRREEKRIVKLQQQDIS